jgi:transglutaminase-like putative cysteine protease
METLADPSPDACLTSTTYVDSAHPDVSNWAERVCGDAGAASDRARAVALFLAVRDGLRYDPYAISREPSSYKASHIVHQQAGYCIPKAVLLTATCRAMGIPARLGFADVRNHLQSGKLSERMGTDIFAYHGYSELWLGGLWVKVSSAFNRELCERFGTRVLEFDGEQDALMHAFDAEGRQHMEYVRDRGSFIDLPLAEIMLGFAEVYGDFAKFEPAGAADRDEAFDA